MISADYHSPRWYILTYLGNHRDALKHLALIDLPSFAPEFYALESTRSCRQDFMEFGSYAFVFGTQDQIYGLKRQFLRSFNFLPMAHGNGQCHPYVAEAVIEQLRLVEAANDGRIPYMPYPTDVVVGDSVRILVGEFAGQEAKATTKKGSKYREIVLEIADKFLVPLCKLKVGEYEIVQYNEVSDQHGTGLVTKEDREFLHQALGRHYGVIKADDATKANDCILVNAIATRYRYATPTTHLQRIKLSVMLTVAYTILDDVDEQRHYIEHTVNLVSSSSNPAHKASAYCTLYGCTFNEEYFNLYISALKNAKEGRNVKSIAQASQLMDEYRRWSDMLHPRKSRRTLLCSDDAPCWYVIETAAPLADVTGRLTQCGMTFCDLSLTTDSGNVILLVRTTFEELLKLWQSWPSITIVRENRDGDYFPLCFDDVAIDDYRFLLSAKPDNVAHLDLTAEYDAILTKAKRKTVTIEGRKMQGIIGTYTAKRRRRRRFILHLRHLCAIAIPFSLTDKTHQPKQ